MSPRFYTPEQMLESFWSRVEKGADCWTWTGGVQSNGYGLCRFNRKQITAHRASFQIHNPAVPIAGMDICHRCDNRLCVNPDHLFVGTRRENMADMVRKGRSMMGGRNPQAKLTLEQVTQIRADTRPQRVIAGEYGVTPSVISRVRRGEAYASC